MPINARLKKKFRKNTTANKGVNRLARNRDPNRDKSFEIFKEHGGNIQNRVLAEMLGVPEKTISAWKSRDKWTQQVDCSTTKAKCSTTKKKSKPSSSIYDKKREQIINALVEAGTYSPALDLLIEIYLDAYEEYAVEKNEKLRKELAKYLGQLGLDGRNKELIRKSGTLLAKGEDEKEKDPTPSESSKLVQFRQRMQR